MPTELDHDIDGLTDEEREGLAELQALESEVDEDEPEFDPDSVHTGEQEEDDEGEDAKPTGDAGEEGKPADDDGGANDGDDGAEPAQAEVTQAAPILVADLPADIESQLQKIGTDKAALIQQFDDGEITAKEYQTQYDALSKQERAIEFDLHRADLAARMEAQREETERNKAIEAFLAEVNIPRDQNNLRFAALDVAVRMVANQEESASLSPREILQKAYDLCLEHGTLQDTRKAKAEAPKPKAAPKPAAPVTLANLPSSDISETDSSRFAYLDRIKDPDARDAAFAKLSPEEQDAYLASGG